MLPFSFLHYHRISCAKGSLLGEESRAKPHIGQLFRFDLRMSFLHELSGKVSKCLSLRKSNLRLNALSSNSQSHLVLIGMVTVLSVIV